MFHSEHQKQYPKLKEVGDMWLHSLEPVCKKSTLVKYTNQLNKYIYPQLGEKEICYITNADVISFSHLLLTGNGSSKRVLSPKSTSDILSRMMSIQKFGVMNGYKVGYLSNCVRVPQRKKEIRVLSVSEQEVLLHYIMHETNLTTLGILICLFTGIRLGELCALKWNSISLTDKELRIKYTMQRLQSLDASASCKTYISIDEPKSSCSMRSIPLPEFIIQYIIPYYKEDSYVLTGDKVRFVEPRTMENRFKSILKKCGIEDANFHALRHTFATRCVEAGFDIKSLSEILGHANVNITLNRYVHPSMQLKRENMNKLSEFFS